MCDSISIQRIFDSILITFQIIHLISAKYSKRNIKMFANVVIQEFNRNYENNLERIAYEQNKKENKTHVKHKIECRYN